MAFNLLIAALGSIHTTLLSKRLAFRTLMKVSSLSTLVSSVTAVIMAWNGYGVWSLAAQTAVMSTTTTALLWFYEGWRPILVFRRASVRKLFGFGGYHLASTLLDIVYSRLYTLLIGRYYGIRELGIYSNADLTRQMPTGFLSSVLTRVAFPMFAEQAGDPPTLRRGMQLALRGMMLINAPVMLGIAALAEPLVLTLFGSQWVAAAPILRVLCLAGVLLPVHVINLQALMALGESKRMFRVEVSKKFLGTCLIVAGAFYGVIDIAWSQVIFSVLAVFINAYYAERMLHYGAASQARDFIPPVGIAALMGALVFAIASQWDPPALIELGVLGVVGCAVFFAMAWIFNLDALRDVVALFRRPAAESIEQTGRPS